MSASTTSRTPVVALWTLTVLAAVMFLRIAYELLIPIVIAVLLSYALEPIVARLERVRIPRAFGAGLVVGLLMAGTAWGLYASREHLTEPMNAVPDAIRRLSEQVGGRQVARQAEEATQSPELVQRGVGWIVSGAGHVTVVTFLVYFLLISGRHFKQRLVELSGPHLSQRRITMDVLDEIDEQIQRFLQVTALTSIIVGAATWGALAVMGIRQAAVWGVLAGVFNSISYFGAPQRVGLDCGVDRRVGQCAKPWYGS